MVIIYKDIRQMWKSLAPFTEDDLSQCLYDFHRKSGFAECRRLYPSTILDDAFNVYNGGTEKIFTEEARQFIQGIRKVDDFLLPLVIKKIPVNMGIILRIHKIITQNALISKRDPPKTFRLPYIKQGDRQLGDPQKEMSIALEKLNKALRNPNHNPLRVAALFYSRFLATLPFSYGNAHIARMLLNYILLIQDEPPVILFGWKTKKMNRALSQSRRFKDVGILMNFLKDSTVDTWKSSPLCYLWKYKIVEEE